MPVETAEPPRLVPMPEIDEPNDAAARERTLSESGRAGKAGKAG
jgi:hypothetical protein